MRLKRSSVISDWMFLCFAVLITVCGMYIYICERLGEGVVFEKFAETKESCQGVNTKT